MTGYSENSTSNLAKGAHWFLCSEAYQAFKAAEQCNRQVEEAFGTLEGALDAALGRLEVGSEQSP